MYDLVILGAGPAGLTAAVYAARAGLDFVVLEQDGYGGGQITASHEVENYPGLGHISGADLGEAFRAQAEMLGAEIQFGVVQSLRQQEGYWELLLEDDEPIHARAVIAATGAVPRKLNIPGEELSGVSYCATCDGAFSAGKDVLVIGGGDTAVEDALYLSNLCRHVTIALRRDVFRAAKRRVDQLLRQENVTVLYNTKPVSIHGESHVSAVTLEHGGEEKAVPFHAVFVAAGVEPVSDYLSTLPLPLQQGYLAAPESCETELPGLFVAGDLRQKALRQVVTAVADGANAASSAAQWLRQQV